MTVENSSVCTYFRYSATCNELRQEPEWACLPLKIINMLDERVQMKSSSVPQSRLFVQEIYFNPLLLLMGCVPIQRTSQKFVCTMVKAQRKNVCCTMNSYRVRHALQLVARCADLPTPNPLYSRHSGWSRGSLGSLHQSSTRGPKYFPAHVQKLSLNCSIPLTLLQCFQIGRKKESRSFVLS